nr:hypothetical protein [uncultured Enterobacter sp.]
MHADVDNITPVTLDKIKRQLLDLNNRTDIPFSVIDEGKSVVATWKITDATWIEIFGLAGLKKNYELRLFFNATDRKVTYREKSTDITWSADLKNVTFHKQVRFGSRREMVYESSWGIKDDGSFGQQYSYKFSTSDIKNPVFDIIKKSGWQLQVSAVDKNVTRLVWFFFAILAFLGVCIFLF